MAFGRAARAEARSASNARVVGSADFEALAVLRTFRGKLVHAVEIDPQAVDQMALVIDSNPPDGGGAIGGDDLAITPDNLAIINRALSTGGEPWMVLELVAPADWRSDTETAKSSETVGQLLPRVALGIDRILARVHEQEQEVVGAEPSAKPPSPPGGAIGWLIPIGMMVGAVLVIEHKMKPMMAAHNRSMRKLSARTRSIGIRPSMTPAEQRQVWNAHYAKHGQKRDEFGRIVKLAGGSKERK